MQIALRALHSWYFGPIHWSAVAVCRFWVGIYLSWYAIELYRWMPLVVGPHAVAANSTSSNAMGLFSLLVVVDEIWLGKLLALTLLTCGIAIFLGLPNRFFLLAGFLVLRTFTSRNSLVHYGGNEVISIVLIGLACIRVPSRNVWSIIRHSVTSPTLCEHSSHNSLAHTPGWPLQLLKLQLLFLYLSAFLHKMESSPWWRGEYLDLLSEDRIFVVVPLDQLFTNVPGLGHCLTWGTLGFEAVVGFLALIPATRSFAIFSGLMFHSILQVVMNVHWFNIAMFALWAVCFKDADFSQFDQRKSIPHPREPRN